MRLDTPPPARGPYVVGIPRRSLYSSVDEGRAIAQTLLAARGNIRPTAVIHGGRVVGVVRGESVYSDRVAFQKVPAQYRMAWSNYNDVITSLSNSQHLPKMWHKTSTTGAAASSWYDLWPVDGIPGAGSVAGAANTANKYDDTSTGAMYLGGNVSPSIKTLVSTWVMVSTGAPQTILLYDRVLDYQANAYTAAANQAMTNTNTAQRYVAAGQPGLLMTWSTNTVHNGTASNITLLDYTDNTGAAAVMPTTPTVSVVVSGAAPTTTLGSRIIAPAVTATTLTWGAFLPLASQTLGARKVVDYTTSAANTGTFILALVYPIAYISTGTNAIPSEIDQIYQIPAMERLYDGAAISAMAYVPSGHITGNLDVDWG